MLIQANHKHNVIIVIINVYMTAKLTCGLHHDATVVDYNLFFFSFFNFGDVKYPAHARLQKIETHSCLVI